MCPLKVLKPRPIAGKILSTLQLLIRQNVTATPFAVDQGGTGSASDDRNTQISLLLVQPVKSVKYHYDLKDL